MNTRRQFIRRLLQTLSAGAFLGPLWRIALPARASATDVEILPPGTDPRSLVDRNPDNLDTRHLRVMPLSDFKTMGLSDHQVDPTQWCLSVEGKVKAPLRLGYDQLRAFAALRRNVLLICPGVFCNHGNWQGVSIRTLLSAAGAEEGITHITVSGPAGPYRKTHRIALASVATDRAFLAYGVNGVPLPTAHGFPLRLVSEGDYGFDWIKYVDRLSVERIESGADGSGSKLTTF